MLLQTFGFLHPVMALAAIGFASIPILIHLINRRRHRKVLWAAMLFLLAATRHSRRRLFLEQWLLLAIRVAALAILLLATARPFLGGGISGEAGLMKPSRVHRILVVDDTLSMMARETNGERTFDSATQSAQRLVESFGPDDPVSVVTVSAGREPVYIAHAVDHHSVQSRLAMLSPTYAAADWLAALKAVEQLMRQSTLLPTNQSIHVISDFAETDWGGDDGSAGDLVRLVRRLAEKNTVTLLCAREGPLPNLSVSHMAMESALVGAGVPTRFFVEVTNHGPNVARGASLRVSEGPRIIFQTPLPAMEPGVSVVESGSVMIPAPGVRVLQAVVSTATDHLPEDDQFHLSFQARDGIDVLIVDGRPGGTLMEGRAGYLATALAPKMRSTDPVLFNPKVVSDFELTSEAIEEFDLVAMCDVRRLRDDVWTRLANFVRAGGALFITVGDQVAADHYNRQGLVVHELLPGRLAESIVPKEGMENITRFRLAEPPPPMLSDFAKTPESGLFAARVARYVPVEVGNPQVQVLLRYGTGDPALLMRQVGAGRVALLTTTADMAWTNLPSKGDFVSLMLALGTNLVRDRGAHRNLRIGEPAVEPLQAHQVRSTIKVVASSGSVTGGALRQTEAGGLEYRTEPISTPGTVRLQIGTESVDFAITPPATESPLRPLTSERLTAVLGDRVRISTFKDGDVTSTSGLIALSTGIELARPALLTGLILLFVEMILALFLGAGRRGSEGRERT